MSTEAKVLLSALADFATGVTVGVLFAPDKGSNTRKKIARQGEDYAEDLEEKFNAFIQEITNKFETMKEDATRMSENGKHQAKEVIEK